MIIPMFIPYPMYTGAMPEHTKYKPPIEIYDCPHCLKVPEVIALERGGSIVRCCNVAHPSREMWNEYVERVLEVADA